MLQAGAATLDITPPLGVSLAGSFTDRIATGIDDPLSARAVVWEDASGPAGRIALVSCDLICMPGEVVRQARELVGRAGAVPPERVLVAATHTHTAPAPTDLLGARRVDWYVEALPARIATAVSLAAQRLRPARAGWGVGREDRGSFNRRYRMRDGTVRMNPGLLNPDALEPAGPIDPDLGVLWTEGEDGAPLAALASFALHYVGTDTGLHISADYFGHFGRWMQRLYGPDLVAILLNGASGDINNIDIRDPQRPRGHRQARRVAGVLAGGVLRLVEQLRPSGEVTLGAASARFPFRRKRITSQDLELAARILALPADTPPAAIRERAGLGRAGPFSWVVGHPLPDQVLRTYARQCQLLAALPEELETEVQVLRIGNCAIVALPGEIFVELGLAIKARSPFQPGDGGATLIAALANDYIGYVPTRRAQEQEGGYETWAARSALPAAGTGEALADLAVALLERAAVA